MEISLRETESGVWDISPAIDTLGTAEFSRVLLETFNLLLQVNHLVIIRIDRNFMPQMVVTESFGIDPVAQQASERYTKMRLHHGDPNFETILKQPEIFEGALVTHLLTENITDVDYRREVFEKSNIIERVSIISQRSGRWFTVNIYRDTSVGVFKPTELARVTQYAGLVSSLAAKHISLSVKEEWSQATRPPLSTLENMVRAIGDSLSNREVEVCARALSGMTSEGIGLELDIKATTITTHRKRAYAKLNISTTNELFALCLGHSMAK